MPRTISLSNVNLSDGALRLAHLVEINFDVPVYMTDYAHDLIDGVTYQASSHLLGLSDVSESGKLRVGSYSIQLSAVSQEYVSMLLSQNWINRTMIIKRAFIFNGAIDGTPFTLFEGQLTNFEIDENKDKSTIRVTAASHWADFERVTGRLTNDSSQKYYFAGDNGMRYAAQSVKNLKWGSN